MRVPHNLKSSTNTELPSHHIFVDTETKSKTLAPNLEQASLWFGFAAYTRRHRGSKWTDPKWVDFTKPDEFWDWVETYARNKRKLYIWAHNMGFDMTILKAVKILSDRGWELKAAIVDDPPTILKWRKDKATILLVDSMNLFSMSLARVGKYIGLDKLDFPPKGSRLEVWREYCKRDVGVLMKAIQTYMQSVKDWELGPFRTTLAGQAFSSFRHRFMNHKIFIDCNDKALGLARSSYAGGRTEAFYLGKVQEPIYQLDINSMYPSVMFNEHVPIRLETTWQRLTTTELLNAIEESLCVASVTINTDQPIYPLKYDGRLVFPIGRFQTTLNTPELKHALINGHVEKVGLAAFYQSAVIFRDYVEFFWNKRLEANTKGDEVSAWLCKLMLNSLYGKFGQTGRVYDTVEQSDDKRVRSWVEYDLRDKSLHKYRSIGGLVQEQINQGESYESFPAIASHITSGARLMLWNLINQAGTENVYYTDTDSLMLNRTGYNNLKHLVNPSKLGALKLEWTSSEVTIRGVKDYTVEELDKIKGVRKDARYLGGGIYEQAMFRGVKGMIRDGDMERQLIHKVTKKLSRDYLKGQRTVTGRVVPLVFPL